MEGVEGVRTFLVNKLLSENRSIHDDTEGGREGGRKGR